MTLVNVHFNELLFSYKNIIWLYWVNVCVCLYVVGEGSKEWIYESNQRSVTKIQAAIDANLNQ